MPRILALLLIAFMLMPSPHGNKPSRVAAGPLVVAAARLPLDSLDPKRRTLGALTFLGAWQLTSTHSAFGGISALLASPDGALLGLNDSGVLMGFDILGRSITRPFIAPLPIRRQDAGEPQWRWDSESLAHDPISDRYWVGFELIQRICRYGPGFSRVEACAEPPEMQDWPLTGGLEAMVRFSNGRFLLFGEMAESPSGVGNDVLLFAGDPTEPGVKAARLSYVPPHGYVPTDAVALNDHRLLVLNRRLGLDGFTAILALVDLPRPLHAGTVLRAKPVARFAPPILAENFEGLALSQEGDRRVLWIAADDNHEFYQRSLILKFALPKAWN